MGGALERVGEWRYAVIGPMYAPVEDLSWQALTEAWRNGEIVATAETAAAVGSVLGAGAPVIIDRGALPLDAALVAGGHAAQHVRRDTRQAAGHGHAGAPGKAADRGQVEGAADRGHAARLAIVPADELVPAWKVVTIDGRHPLEVAPSRLAVPLCAVGDGATVRNIDPERLTTVALTGVTAMTRLTAELMDRKGVDYPIKDVEPWLAATDLVHISNEVSFVSKDCKPYKSMMTEFCSRDGYIKLLEAAHASIIELTGSHLPDYGRSWIEHSLALYRERGWVWFGGGHDQLDGTAPRIVEHHGNRLGFLGCNMPWTTSHVITEGPGVAACDLERMKWQIGELVRDGVVPIVSIQHEEVYHHEPPDEIVRDFRGLAAAGAAVVNGSQAHCAHPWEVHRGAYVHYGSGNFLFDQQASNTQDATADRLYVYANRLLTVGHLYTRLEEFGRPRPMTPRERTGYLAVMASVLAKVPAADPWTAPSVAPATRSRPDSFLVGTQLTRITVTVPATLEAGRRYPLIIDLAAAPTLPAAAHTPQPATAHAGAATGSVSGASDAGAFRVTLRHPGEQSAKLTAALRRFMIAKYAVDAGRITVRRTAPAVADRGPAGRDHRQNLGNEPSRL